MDDPDAPKDRFNLAVGGVFLLGMGALLPWNFFITATGYFHYKLRNLDDPNTQTELQTLFENYVTVSSLVPNLLFLFINTVLTRIVSHRKRMITSLLLMIVIFLFTTALVIVDSDDWQMLFFILTIISVVLINTGAAVMNGANYGLGSILPPLYMQSMLIGEAFGGIFATLSSIASLALGSSPISSATGYFSIAVVVLVASLIVYILLFKSAFVQYYVAKSQAGVETDKSQHMINEVDGISPEVPPSGKTTVQYFLSVLKKCRMYAASICLSLFVTLTVFPSITAAIRPMNKLDHSEWNLTYFTPVCCFLLFNFSDFMSRFVATWLPLSNPDGMALPILAVLRGVFIPLFMLCNAQPRHSLPVIFNSDIFFVVFMIVLGFSNGYLIINCLVHGPRKASEDEQEMAGSMMGFFLVVGLALGSAASFASTAIFTTV